MSTKLTDAVRILMYGNGDLLHCIADVAKIVAEEDGVEVPERIFANRLNNLCLAAGLAQYDRLSGEDWNKIPD